jgi:hypothetical protein
MKSDFTDKEEKRDDLNRVFQQRQEAIATDGSDFIAFLSVKSVFIRAIRVLLTCGFSPPTHGRDRLWPSTRR